MDVGEVRPVTTGTCEDLSLVETGMFDVTGYGGVYILNAERPAIVETGIGTNADVILDALDDVGITPTEIDVIALTHVHLDHAGGAGFLADACERATIAVHEIGAPHLVDPSRLVEGTKRAVGDQWRYYTEPRPVAEKRIRTLADGDVIDLGDHILEARHAPGHAPHQVIFHDSTMDAVFTGDAAGLWIPAWEAAHQTTPPPNFDLPQAIEDVDTIRELSPATLLFTHFGPAAYTAERLDRYADTLTEWVRTVETARRELGDDEAVVEHFVERTELEDVWGERKARAETRINVAGVLTYLDRRES